MKIWMFSGQGTQYYQMGRELYERERVFRECLDRGDAIVRPLINESVVEVIYRPRPDRFEPFRRVLHAHPAIVMVEYALAQVLFRRGLRPDMLLGYSLGELTSLAVAESVVFEELLTMVVKLAELLEYCAPEGRMLAVLGSPELIREHPDAFRECEVAGYNFRKSFIISGPVESVEKLKVFLKERSVTTMDLPVAYPFHSRLMKGLDEPSLQVARKLKLSPPKIPIASAATGEVLREFSLEHMRDATRGCVDLARTLRSLEASGPHLYVDLGPSGSMATAVKYTLAPDSRSQFHTLITPFGQECTHIERLATDAAESSEAGGGE